MKTFLVLLLASLPAMAGALPPAQILVEATRRVVVVRAYGDTPGAGRAGSGVLVRPGMVMTHCALVTGSRVFTVQLEGSLSVATLAWSDDARDLCMLKTLPSAPFDRDLPGSLRLVDFRGGQDVFAVGAPGGQNLATVHGSVIDGWPKADGTLLIQTDGQIAPGALGGGLFDDAGRLIGITLLQLTATQALALAVPWAPVPEPVPGDDAMRQYALSISREIGKDQLYPREARLKGWSGAVEIRVAFGADGEISNVEVAKSSGYPVLDEEAIAKVMRTPGLPEPPERLRGQPFTIRIPIVFRVE